MRRGDVVMVAAPGDYGKPRPAVIVQSDALPDLGSVILCPFTTFERDAPMFRLKVEATPSTGLRERSEVMVEKVQAVQRGRCKAVVGALDPGVMAALDEMLGLVLGLADTAS